MHIKEYIEITKDGKRIVSKESPHFLIKNFTKQMHDRGFVALSYVCDPSKYNKEVKSIDDIPSSFEVSENFEPNDLINLIMTYLGGFPPKLRMHFLNTLHNCVMTDALLD